MLLYNKNIFIYIKGDNKTFTQYVTRGNRKYDKSSFKKFLKGMAFKFPE